MRAALRCRKGGPATAPRPDPNRRGRNLSKSKVTAPDPAELALRASGAVGAEIDRVEALHGGASSFTYSAQLHGSKPRKVVIKVAPPGLEPVRNRDVLRQAKVLKGLADAPGVMVPAVLGTDGGAPPEIPPLMVMSFAAGESYEPVLRGGNPGVSDAEVQARAFAAAQMLAALQRADAGRFEDERETDLEREVGRWARAFATVDRGLQGDGRADDVNAALQATLPEKLPPVVLHGDYRLGNMQCAGTEIRALIDWEIWSLGDPRLDLAWFLLNSDPRHPNRKPGGDRMPPIAELLDAYEQATGRSVEHFGWFSALVRYKQAAASALIVKNNRRLARAGVDTASMEKNIPRLLDWAGQLLV